MTNDPDTHGPSTGSSDPAMQGADQALDQALGTTPSPGINRPAQLQKRFDPASFAQIKALARHKGIELPDSPEDPSYPAKLAELSKVDPAVASRLASSVRDPNLEAANEVIGANVKAAQRNAAPAELARKIFYIQNSRGEPVLNKTAILVGAGAILLLGMTAIVLNDNGTKSAVKAKPATTTATRPITGAPGTTTTTTTTTGSTPPTTTATTTVPSTQTGTEVASAALSPTTPPNVNDLQPTSTGSSTVSAAAPSTSYSTPSSTYSAPSSTYSTPTTSDSGYTSLPTPPVVPSSSGSSTTGTASTGVTSLPTTTGATGTTASAYPTNTGTATLTPRPTGMVLGRGTRTSGAPGTSSEPAANVGSIVRASRTTETNRSAGETTAQGNTGQNAATQNSSSTGTNTQGNGTTGVNTSGIPVTGTAGQGTQPAMINRAATGQNQQVSTRPVFTLVRANAAQNGQSSAGQTNTGQNQSGGQSTGQTGTQPASSTFDQIYGNAAQAGMSGTTSNQSASQSSAVQTGTNSSAAPMPYHTGQKLRARLETGVSTVSGATGLPVYARSEDGTLWRGVATGTPERRLNVIFNLAILPSGQEVAMQGAAYDLNTFVGGLAPNVRNSAPNLAQDLINNALAGFKTYADASIAARSTTTLPNGTTTSTAATPDLGTVIAGSAASAFNIPSTQGSFVQLLELPAGTPLLLVVGAASSSN